MTSFRYAVFFKCAMYVSTAVTPLRLVGGGILSNEFLKVKAGMAILTAAQGGVVGAEEGVAAAGARRQLLSR